MALPFKEYYGQDFGTSAPAGMVGVKFDKNNCYCREINYLPMSMVDVGKNYCKLKLDKTDKIIVDSAEPEWRKLRDGFKPQDLTQDDIRLYPQLLKGFYAMPCHKGVDAGITLMESLNLYAVEESINLWDEINKRIYAKDKNGNYTNVPEPGFDHLQDPWIYVVTDQRGWRSSEDITVKSN